MGLNAGTLIQRRSVRYRLHILVRHLCLNTSAIISADYQPHSRGLHDVYCQRMDSIRLAAIILDPRALLIRNRVLVNNAAMPHMGLGLDLIAKPCLNSMGALTIQ